MRFEAERKETVMLNPRKNMKKRTVSTEIRRDPLTGRTSRICHLMRLQWEKQDYSDLAEATRENCPFCWENVLNLTPHFPANIVREGRIVSDDMVLFPNIAPYDGVAAVVTMGKSHFLAMTEIEPERVSSALGLCLSFFRGLEDSGHSEAVYHLVSWNYMPVSGSSLIHPHLQVFSTSTAPNFVREELQAAQMYTEKRGTNYWDDLVSIEKARGERYLGTTGRTHWLSAYAPLGVADDVLAVVEGVERTVALTAEDVSDLALGLTKAMAAYDRIGIMSFNMGFFTGGKGDSHARFHMIFTPRAYFNQAVGTPDVNSLRILYNEPICMGFPEDIAKLLLSEFGSDRF
ncbi:hypothetical protein ACFL0Q_02495 [Thermodesulfobacteriota bacterium]